MNHNKLGLNTNLNKIPTFSTENKDNNEINKNNTLLMFERLLNNKNKFKLDNHFDNVNSHQFLLEKEKYLSEINIDDGDYSTETLERNKSRTELLIPNGAPTQCTFGQK